MTSNVQHAPSPEEFSKAMNFIGQNLLSTLIQSIQELPAPLRNNEMVLQGLAAFLSNVIHKQWPDNKEARKETLDRFTKIVNAHLANIAEVA